MTIIFEFRKRYPEDMREWTEIPAVYVYFRGAKIEELHKQAFEYAKKLLELDVKEVRFNREGSQQGHYVFHSFVLL